MGGGEGESNAIPSSYIPLPLIPFRQGRENLTLYENIKVRNEIYRIGC